jgi:hypothetical protein
MKSKGRVTISLIHDEEKGKRGHGPLSVELEMKWYDRPIFARGIMTRNIMTMDFPCADTGLAYSSTMEGTVRVDTYNKGQSILVSINLAAIPIWRKLFYAVAAMAFRPIVFKTYSMWHPIRSAS